MLGTKAFSFKGRVRVLTDLERARALLKEDEGGFDEAELARLSEAAGKQNPDEP
jgi:hypothetical protein